jgi:manganese efflux pump family protein
MNALTTLTLALSMSADAFAVTAGKGVALKRPRAAEVLRTGAVFGGVEMTFAVLGWCLGALASSYITAVDHWIAFAILGALGVKMIAESLGRFESRKKPKRHKWRSLAVTAIGTSIDSMGVGVTLAFIDVNIWVTALAIGCSTFVMSSLGLVLGHLIGSRIGRRAEALGGLVLIAIGIRILVEHLGNI